MKNKYLSCQIEKNLKICSENEEKMIETVLESQNFRLRRAKSIPQHSKLWIIKLCQKSHTISFEKIGEIRKNHI